MTIDLTAPWRALLGEVRGAVAGRCARVATRTHRRSSCPDAPPTLERLEPRLLLSAAATYTIDGPVFTDEGARYTLDLSTDSALLVYWTIDWGDGRQQVVEGNNLSVDHFYADGPSRYEISATATNVDGSYLATVVGGTPGGMGLDDSFNGSGTVTTFLDGNFGARGLALAADGRIVVASSVFDPLGTRHDFALLRYNVDGSPDPGFAGGAPLITDFGSGLSEVAEDVAVDSQPAFPR